MGRLNGKTILVTGGGGFLGKALVQALLRDGAVVKSVSRSWYPELDALGVEQYSVDISNPSFIGDPFFQGITDIFHTAAKVDMWGAYKDFVAVNVEGTKNLLQLCNVHGIQHFIFTSSPSVIACGKDLRNVDESYPYPIKPEADYPATKAIAERLVVRAGKDHVQNNATKTITLRPHLLFGPGDTSLEYLIIKKAKAGRLVQVGNGKNLADFCFIDDCVEAHIKALVALQKNSNLSGNIYFISQGKPILLWQWIEAALKRNGLPAITKKVPAKLACIIGAGFEFLSALTGGRFEPPFTKFLAEEMSTDHYFDISAARRDLGFEPTDRDMFSW